jgi:NAD-dependent DNA ligase
MNIEDWGESVAALLLEKKLIGTAVDLFTLDPKDIAKLSRMGEKSAAIWWHP